MRGQCNIVHTTVSVARHHSGDKSKGGTRVFCEQHVFNKKRSIERKKGEKKGISDKRTGVKKRKQKKRGRKRKRMFSVFAQTKTVKRNSKKNIERNTEREGKTKRNTQRERKRKRKETGT